MSKLPDYEWQCRWDTGHDGPHESYDPAGITVSWLDLPDDHWVQRVIVRDVPTGDFRGPPWLPEVPDVV